MYIERVAVVGAGTMGADIAMALAQSGVPVVLRDVSSDALARAGRHIDDLFRTRVRRGRLVPEEADRRRRLIQLTGDPAALREVDLAIEAVPEDLALKIRVLGELDRLIPPLAVLASNTSALSITALAGASGRPDRTAGFHFFFPAHTMRLVEVVRGPETSAETVDALVRLGEEMRKLTVVVRDSPGFVVNRVLARALAEVFRWQEETGADPAELDALIESDHAAPMGPFRLMDQLGLDVVAEVARTMHAAYGERFAPSADLAAHVANGRLGIKAGSGFYPYGQRSEPS